jgi:EAL domain-containing protein (putative c-di-GMP-specific phosphodiesterase class I)
VREPSPARRRVAQTVAAVARLARPPVGLSARVRWLLAALGLPTMALLAFVTAVRSPAGWPLPPALGLGGGAAAAALRPRADGAALLAEVPAQVPGLTVIATLAYLLGGVLRRQQQAVARERALALDRAALAAELAARATVDPLTGLANRARFLERLGQAVACSAPAATPTSCCATPTWRCTPPSGPATARSGCSTPPCTSALLRLDFEAAPRTAVLEQQFTVRYQPVVELAGGGVVGLEALVRWDHPERGLVMPGEFVGMAEESGLIVPIGRWVLHAACRAARDWQSRFPLVRPLFIGVNLSVRQLQQPDVVQDVAGAVDAAGLASADLVLELTETVLVLDEATVQRLHELRALGVHLAVDNFSIGPASLACLRRLPLDALKLAGPFVDGLPAGAEQAALAQAVMRLAETLGLRVVAEGIEEADQLRALQELGCRYGQGYLFGRRPLDQFAVAALLGAEQRRHAQRPAAAPTASR